MIKKNWLNEYRVNYLKTRFVSQLSAFLISLFSLFSLWSLLRAGNFYPDYVRNHLEEFWISAGFHFLIIVFFGLRFTLLFFNSKKSFWSSQFIWILILINLSIWCAFTNHSFYGFFYEIAKPTSGTTITFDEFPQTNLIYASNTLDYFATSYFFLSPIRQFLTLVISVFKRW